VSEPIPNCRIRGDGVRIVYREGDGPATDDWGTIVLPLTNYTIVPTETWDKLRTLAEAKSDELARMVLASARRPPPSVNGRERLALRALIWGLWVLFVAQVTWLATRLAA